MHRVSIDSFQPETQRYALKRGVGYLNDIQDFLTLRSIPILLRRTAGWWLCTQRSGMASPPAPVTFDPKTRSTRLCGSSRRGFPPCDGAGRCRPAHPRSGDGIFLEPRTGNIAARAVEPSKAEVGVGASAIGLGVAEILLGRHRWPSCKGSGSASLAAELHAIGNGADYVRTHAHEICEAQSPSRKPSRNFAVATPETEG